MDILTFAQPDLLAWKHRALWPSIAQGPQKSGRQDDYQIEVGRELPGPPMENGPHRKVAAAIFSYQIFPPALVEGVLERTPIEAGDTVGIQYHALPGVRLFFAARVVDCFDKEDGALWRTGFTYQTLIGHPELGEETFAVEKRLADGRVVARLRSWSRPGTPLAKLGAPLVRRMQVAASRAALEHLRKVAAVS